MRVKEAGPRGGRAGPLMQVARDVLRETHRRANLTKLSRSRELGAPFGALAGVDHLLYMFFSSFILSIGVKINDILDRHRDTGPLQEHDGNMRSPAPD